jgi:hypothetical protein
VTASTNNPYLDTVNGLWEILEDRPDFTTLVPVGNRIKFTGDLRDPIKTEVSTADLPEVRIYMKSGNFTEIDSNTANDTGVYAVELATGDQRMSLYLMPLRWIIVQAFAQLTRDLKALVDHGYAPHYGLVRAGMMPDMEGMSDPAMNRGIKGWSMIGSVEVKLWMQRNELGV